MSRQNSTTAHWLPANGAIARAEADPALAHVLNAPPDPTRPYVYLGTCCHINKFGILNPAALEKVIRCTTGLRSELLRVHPIAGNFDLKHLCALHRFLFQDVYEWAGEIRIIDFQRNKLPYTSAAEATEAIAQLPADLPPPRQFAKAAEIESECESLFDDLRRELFLRDLHRDDFVLRGANYLTRLFIIHPFRDGNGRSIRAFFKLLAARAGWDLELDSIPQGRRHISAWRAHGGDVSDFLEVFAQCVRGRLNTTS